ncbi:VirB4 family type IV secretion system protein [Mesorhizobium sp. M0976]|uniref:VirB4 family type IV secretion system protein n=1 Tax=Mesorhizobium sp. M0976 TaxID=2957038 RepID=UPI003334E946
MAIARALRDELSFGAVSRRENPVSAHIPYSRHVSDEVIKTQDGMLMSFVHMSGLCFETIDIAEINSRLLGRNDLIRGLANSRYAIYSHIVRREVKPAIESSFENKFCQELDQRYTAALRTQRMFVNDIYLTIVRRELQGTVGTADLVIRKLLGRRAADGRSSSEERALIELTDVMKAVRESLQAYGARVLTVVKRSDVWHSEPLEFLVQLVNGGFPRPMALPRMKLAEALATKRLFFGPNALEIRGASPGETRYGAIISVGEYPSITGPGMLNPMLKVPHEFIVTQSFAIIDKPQALTQMERVGRKIDMSDEAGSIVADQLGEARDELLSSEALYGLHHLTVLCLGKTMDDVARCATDVGTALTEVSALWVREDLNCEPAFWATLPGNFAYVARKSMISSKNMAGFSAFHNYPSGRTGGVHWGTPISVLETTSQTAYFFNFHVRDLGNFTLNGPSGSGKTVLLGFLAAQAQRITPRPKLVMIDKDRGLDIFVRSLGGRYEVLKAGEPSGFNPLRLPDTPRNREFLFQLFSFMLRRSDGHAHSTREEQVIRNAIAQVASAPTEGRTMEEFAELLRGAMRAGDDDLYSRLQPWMRPDQRGWLFNNAEDSFSMSSIFGFDMTSVLSDATTSTAALLYIFHRIEELLDGQPVMIFLDEGWKLLDNDIFSYFIKDKLKTIRKLNGIVGFGTQSAADIVKSSIANTLIEQTPTNIFFPNPKADEESHRAFGLSEREIKWIRETPPEARKFLIKHDQDSVIARLNLGAMPDATKILSGRIETVQELDALRARVGDDPQVWLPIFLGRDPE